MIKEYLFYITGIQYIEIKAQSEQMAKLKLLDELFKQDIITIESVTE